MRFIPSREQTVRRAILLSCLAIGGLALSDLARARFWRELAPDGSLLSYAQWALDLMVGFQPFYGALLVVALGVALFSSKGRSFWTLGLLVFLLIPFVSSTRELSSAANMGSGPTLRLVTANVNFENRNPKKLIDWAIEKKTDVLIIHEVGHAFSQALEQSNRAFPYQVLLPQDGPFGTAILSRLPLTSQNSWMPGFVKVALSLNGRDIELLAAHPTPPLSPSMMTQRNRSLLVHAAALRGSAVIAGDLNATPWHPLLRELEESGWMRTEGLKGTWPSAVPLLGLRLDHVLATPAWKVLESEVGPDIDSDHRPLGVTLQL